MSETNTTHGDGEEGGKVRRELKNLPKLQAPWYFDAELQRRLARAGGRRIGGGLLIRPMPAYAISLVSIVALGVVGYFTLLRPTNQNENVLPLLDSVATGTQQQAPKRPATFERKPQPILPSTQEQPVPSLDQKLQGPSTPTGDQLIESGVTEKAAVSIEDSGSLEIQHTPGMNPDLPLTRSIVDTLRTGYDTIHSIPASRDSVDSTHIRPDSLKRDR